MNPRIIWYVVFSVCEALRGIYTSAKCLMLDCSMRILFIVMYCSMYCTTLCMSYLLVLLCIYVCMQDAETVKSLSNAIASFEGAVIAVSHDESFVNSLLGATATAAASEDKDGINLNTAIYTLSNQRIMRFEGTFQKYKQSIMKSIR